MHNKIDEIKKNESSPKIIKNLFSEDEINKFLNLYEEFLNWINILKSILHHIFMLILKNIIL